MASSEVAVLVTIVTSTDGFDVRLVHATEVARIGSLGRLGSTLPRPGDLAFRVPTQGRRYRFNRPSFEHHRHQKRA